MKVFVRDAHIILKKPVQESQSLTTVEYGRPVNIPPIAANIETIIVCLLWININLLIQIIGFGWCY